MDNLEDVHVDGRSREARAMRSARKEAFVDVIAKDKDGKRPPRVKLEEQGTLDVPPHLMDPAFVYRWQLDKDGKLERYLRAWWEHVVYNGEKVTTPSGDGYTLYLIRLDKETYDQDRAEAAAQLVAKEKSQTLIKQGEYVAREIGQTDDAMKRERDLS